jgi:toxin CcdB
MARFDVYRNPGSQSSTTPYLLDVQSDLLEGLETQMVIPLRNLTNFPVVRLPENLTPVFQINGMDCVLETPKMGAIPRRVLKQPVANLANEHSRIIAALDFLFQGF